MAKVGLMNSDGCTEKPGGPDPAPGALDLGADDQGQRSASPARCRTARTRRAGSCAAAAATRANMIASEIGTAARWRLTKCSAPSRSAPRPPGSPPGSRRCRTHQDRQSEQGPAGRRSTTSAPPGSDRSAANIIAGCAARQCADEIAKAVAARLEIGELVERGAGRRQQHHRAGHVLGTRLLRRRRRPRSRDRRSARRGLCRRASPQTPPSRCRSGRRAARASK